MSKTNHILIFILFSHTLLVKDFIFFTIVRPNLLPHSTVPCPYHTVSVSLSVFFNVPFFTAIATVTVPFYSLTVRSAKRTEPFNFDRSHFSIWPQTVPHQNGNRYSFIIEDREPYRTNMGNVNLLVLRTAIQTAPI